MFVTSIRIYRKYHIFMHFLRKIIFQFSSKEKISCFQGEEIPSFPIIKERSYSRAIFLERPSFQEVWKKNIWFFVQRLFMGLFPSNFSYLEAHSLKTWQQSLRIFPSQQALQVESTSIWHGYYIDTPKTKFGWLSTSFAHNFSI